MGIFQEWKIKELLDDLKQGKIKPDQLVSNDFSDVTLLQALINSETFPNKLDLAEEFISLGCDPDQYGDRSTAISYAVQTGRKGFVNVLLKYHKKGDRSDLDILQTAAGSMDPNLFGNIIFSDKIDINIRRYDGKHILHVLAEEDDYSRHIETIFAIKKDVIVNPKNRKGLSPLTLALNAGNFSSALELSKNPNSELLGNLVNFKGLIDLEIVDKFEGDFWNQEPGLIEYAVEEKKEHLLPNSVKDIFLF